MKNYEILDKMSVQKMITYASSHFWELRKEKLKNLSIFRTIFTVIFCKYPNKDEEFKKFINTKYDSYLI